jgi:peptidoglycan hydrolase-like amidase
MAVSIAGGRGHGGGISQLSVGGEAESGKTYEDLK